MTLRVEWREGGAWCQIHAMWWKQCPCRGQASKVVTLQQEDLDRTVAKVRAFLDALPRPVFDPDIIVQANPEEGESLRFEDSGFSIGDQF